MWTNYQKFLALLMMITGSINTLSTKWADNESVEGSDGSHPTVHPFDHPFLQAVGMFIGEFSCMGMYYLIQFYKKCRNQEVVPHQKFNPLIFLPAAMCDMCGTSIMYVGLTLTYASSFQMLRGAVIIFTAFLSVSFLGRIIKNYMWVGMGCVILGLAVVGVSDIVFGTDKKADTNGIIAGDLLIIMAQIIVATQMVYEERFINKYNVPPLLVVGWEGLFGMTVLGLLLIPFYYINAGVFSKSNPYHRLEDPIDAFTQMGNSAIICLATVGNIVSIAFFNFSGISVTKEMSATTRMVLDSLRTIIIWAVSLAVAWQQFQYLQLIGFAFLLSGMCLYNDVIILPLLKRYTPCFRQDDELHAIVDEDDGNERRRLLNEDRAVVT